MSLSIIISKILNFQFSKKEYFFYSQEGEDLHFVLEKYNHIIHN
jgi:hypothetical protein